jgi:hypothetical protein
MLTPKGTFLWQPIPENFQGEMGCAQETFESILSYLHKDWTHGDGLYLENIL